MASEKSGDQKGGARFPSATVASAPDPSDTKQVHSDQVSISEQAFVDRIKKSDRWMILLTGAIVATGIISACIFWKQLGVMQGQLDAQYKPHLRIRRVMIDRFDFLKAGQPISGQFEVLNFGESTADILGSNVEVFWGPNGLPMNPSEPKIENWNEPICFSEGGKCEMPSGDEKVGKFKSDRNLGTEASLIAANQNTESGYRLFGVGVLPRQVQPAQGPAS